MTLHYQDDWLTVYHGDCRAVMVEMEPESVHCVVTSPPYWGLRDYGDPGQLGLEPTPEEYVANLVAVFREVRRVLRNDGTVWLVLGDSYSVASTHAGRDKAGIHAHGEESAKALRGRDRSLSDGLKPKDLVGIPWRVAFALQADGWYLRSDIIWSKPNPMPESVTDRPTKSHEYLFLLSKSPRYYFDAEAVREPAAYPDGPNSPQSIASPYGQGFTRRNTFARDGAVSDHVLPGQVAAQHRSDRTDTTPLTGRNIRSVWNIATAPYPGAHFATFPPKLVEPCIKAGTSEKGVCPECGAPWERVVEREAYAPAVVPEGVRFVDASRGDRTRKLDGKSVEWRTAAASAKTTGWRPTCAHVSPLPPQPAVVLDCFAGSGTTGMVAQSLSRRAVLIDLSLDYLGQLMDRNAEIPLGLGA